MYKFLLVSVLLLSACSINPNRGFATITNTLNNVVEVSPIVMPMVVVSKPFSNQDILADSIDEINRAMNWRMFALDINEEHHHIVNNRISYGTVSISSMDEELLFDNIHGRDVVNRLKSKIVFGVNVYGEVQFSKVYISEHIMNDRNYLRAHIIHNLLQVLGLDIDGDSIDLNSCLSRDPLYNCRIVEEDIELVKNRLKNKVI